MDSKWFLKSWTILVNVAFILSVVAVEALQIPELEPYYGHIIVLQGVVNFILRFKTVMPVTVTKK